MLRTIEFFFRLTTLLSKLGGDELQIEIRRECPNRIVSRVKDFN